MQTPNPPTIKQIKQLVMDHTNNLTPLFITHNRHIIWGDTHLAQLYDRDQEITVQASNCSTGSQANTINQTINIYVNLPNTSRIRILLTHPLSLEELLNQLQIQTGYHTDNSYITAGGKKIETTKDLIDNVANMNWTELTVSGRLKAGGKKQDKENIPPPPNPHSNRDKSRSPLKSTTQEQNHRDGNTLNMQDIKNELPKLPPTAPKRTHSSGPAAGRPTAETLRNNPWRVNIQPESRPTICAICQATIPSLDFRLRLTDTGPSGRYIHFDCAVIIHPNPEDYTGYEDLTDTQKTAFACKVTTAAKDTTNTAKRKKVDLPLLEEDFHELKSDASSTCNPKHTE